MANGAAMDAMITDVEATAREARETNDPQLVQISDRLDAGVKALSEATVWMRETMASDRETALAGATAYLALAGDVIGGHFLAKGAVEARASDPAMRGKLTALAGFFAETTLAEVPGRVPGITSGGAALIEQSEALFGEL